MPNAAVQLPVLKIDQPGELSRIKSGERFTTVRLNSHPDIYDGGLFKIAADGEEVLVTCVAVHERLIRSVEDEHMMSEGVTTAQELIDRLKAVYPEETQINLDSDCWVFEFQPKPDETNT